MVVARARSSVYAVFRSYSVRHLSFNPLYLHLKVGKPVMLSRSSFCDNVPKVFGRCPAFKLPNEEHRWSGLGYMHFHSSCHLKEVEKVSEPENDTNTTVEGGTTKLKRKKLKGKRAVVRWLKFFRYKKKRDYQRMTAEEKLLYKLNKARKKEERLVADLNKIEPKESSEITHDPEILTPEEHFYFLKMGVKCKNYVPVGRRGIYQGVILNMHLHWKKHQTLKVIVKTFSPEEVKELAVELARLSGGIVLDIHEENEIIMYRGKNYSQPPTEIMSPRITLSRKKALDKSKYRDALRALRRYIPRVEQELELLRVQMRKNNDTENPGEADSLDLASAAATLGLKGSNRLKELMGGGKSGETLGSDDETDPTGLESDSEDLSDIFESDLDDEESDGEDEMSERPLYMDQFDKFPTLNKESGDCEKWMSSDLKGVDDGKKFEEADAAELDEIDQIFLKADMLLKRKRK